MERETRSNKLSDFLDFIKRVESDYTYYSQCLGNEDKLTQDLLHKLELESTGYRERNKIAALLSTSRKDRRYYKDQVEELQPLFDVITDSKHKSCIEHLKQALGKIRKSEAYHKDRRYYPRILKEGELTKHTLSENVVSKQY